MTTPGTGFWSVRTIFSVARASLAAGAMLVAPSLGGAQPPKAPASQPSPCQPPVWGDLRTPFDARVRAYAALRDRLEAELPPPVATAEVTPARATQRALAIRIRSARVNARQGDLFTAAIAAEIRKSLRWEIDARTWKVIMDEDNPGELPSQVNDEYREGQPLSTMPPNILAALPALPRDLEYRFVGRTLILLDTRSKLIVDRIPSAVSLADAGRGCR